MIMDISDMGFTDELSSLQPGMNIGNLHVVSFLGKGAIGEVYLTQHDILGKQFALKVIPKGFSPMEAAEGFKQAAQIQMRLSHPNIIQIDDLGEEDMFYWMRMEYIEGEVTPSNMTVRSLDDLLRAENGFFTPDEISYYFYYVLLGLDHAHNQGVIHAALKPSNLMVAEDGVKIAELGVTDLIGHAWDDFHLLRTNPLLEPTQFDPLPGFSRQLPTLLNVFDYYSPEQKAGAKATAQSNLYSVGVMVYRMLTARETLSFDFPSTLVDGLDPAWDDWIAKATAYDPAARFATAAEMLEAMPRAEA